MLEFGWSFVDWERGEGKGEGKGKGIRDAWRHFEVS